MKSSTSSGVPFWIGLNDKFTEGAFVWDSGHEVYLGLLSNWQLNQPSNRTGEDCVIVRENGGLYPLIGDKMCNDNTRAYNFVCQKRIFQYDWEVLKNVLILSVE